MRLLTAREAVRSVRRRPLAQEQTLKLFVREIRDPRVDAGHEAARNESLTDS